MEILDHSASCLLCPQHCQLRPGQVGRCKARSNVEGDIVSLTYGEVAAWHVDPIEKKPLYHFYPGSQIFSVAGYGCNLSCTFCQNYEISQQRASGHKVTPRKLADLAKDSLGICFTYSEPTIWYEMIRDTAPLVKQQGGKVVLVSNGMIAPRFLEELLPSIDAMNIDIKGYSEEFYLRYTGGKLSWVLETVERAVGKTHLEITTLIIPGANDDPREIEGLAKWLSRLNSPVVWHLSRYFPAYRLTSPPTEKKVIHELAEIAKTYVPYVYLGNMPDGNTTYCPQCQAEVIGRGYRIVNRLQNGVCPVCGFEIYGVGL